MPMAGTESYFRGMTPGVVWLRRRQGEIEESIAAAVSGAAIEPQSSERELVSGQRELTSALIESALASLESGVAWSGRIPAVAALHGRRAALAAIDLSTLIQSHVLIHTVCWERLIDVLDEDGHVATAERAAIRTAASAASRALLSCALSAMAEGYVQRDGDALADRRQVELVKSLLTGGQAPTSADYPVDATHVGLVWLGQDIGDLVLAIAREVGARALILRHVHDAAWAWISARCGLDAAAVTGGLASRAPIDVRVGVGEPDQDAAGFRHTHRQANAALAVANLSVRRIVQYADVTLLAHALQDDTLAKSLTDVYLVPLGDPNAGGEVLRQTLRAYFRAGRNATAAANALRVDRSTIKSRLSVIEECLGRARYAQQAELEVALALEQLRSSGATDRL